MVIVTPFIVGNTNVGLTTVSYFVGLSNGYTRSMPDDEVVTPPTRLRQLAQWQVNKIATLGARLTARRMPLGGRTDFAVLAALDEYGALSQAELGRRLGLDRNDVNVVVNRLQSDGRLDRQSDPADRRRNTITLTAGGRQHLEELQSHADAVMSELLRGLDESEQKQLQGLLAKVLASHAAQSA